MSHDQTILVLGGGVGGVVTAVELRKKLPKRHRIVLVDKEQDHAFAPSLLWLMTGNRDAKRISRPLGRLGDKGIDVVATIQFGITTVVEVVQVKRHKGSVSRDVLDQLRGALHYRSALRGTIITTGKFSKGCKDAALLPGAPPIGLIDGEHLVWFGRGRELIFAEFPPLEATTSFQRLLAARALDQDPPHRLGRGGEEVPPTGRRPSAIAIDQAQIGLVHQRRGLKRLARCFAGHHPRRQLTQLVVDQWQQLVSRPRLTPLDRFQDSRHLAHAEYCTTTEWVARCGPNPKAWWHVPAPTNARVNNEW